MSETAGACLRDLGEVALVERIVAILASGNEGGPFPVESAHGVRVGPGDDAAVVGLTGAAVISIDSQHEDVHYRDSWIDPTALGRRAISVSASDLGAMGATPVAFVAALALRGDTRCDWVERLVVGMQARAAQYGACVVGGDVVRVEGRVAINVTAIGNIEPDSAPILRSGARPGDRCFLTGNPGRAAAGRALLEAGYRLAVPGDGAEVAGGPRALADEAAGGRCLRAFLSPEPPVSFGAEVAAKRLVGAMMDVSDGVAVDLGRLCRASDVGVLVEHDALADDADLRSIAADVSGRIDDWILAGGDDYELLCAVSPSSEEAFRATAAARQVTVRRVGELTDSDCGARLSRDGVPEPLTAAGWDHFS